MSTPSPITILVTNDGMGNSNTALQHTLVTWYFQLLLDDDKLPGAICFYADGVRLVCDGSPALDQLLALEESGVPLIVCSTCLNALELADQQRVGIVGGMGDIIEAQWRADKVITL